jgi:hypothetical protein
MLVRYRIIEQKKDSQTGESRGGMQKQSLRLIKRDVRFLSVNNLLESPATPCDNRQCAMCCALIKKSKMQMMGSHLGGPGCAAEGKFVFSNEQIWC